MSILSLAPLTVLPASPLAQIDAAHAAGFDAVGLRLQPVVPTDADIMGNAALMRDIERRLDATGLKVLDIEVFRVGPRTDVRSMLPAMEFASTLGAKYLLCYAQLCDAPAEFPPASQFPAEARSHRLYPGEGSLPLLDLLDALPPGIPLSLEAPDSRSEHLSAPQRAHAIARCTRKLLQARDGRGAHEVRGSA